VKRIGLALSIAVMGLLLGANATAQPTSAPSEPARAQTAEQPAAYRTESPPIRFEAASPEGEQQGDEKARHDERDFTFGVGLFGFANVHGLDQPEHRRVTVDGVRSVDRQYPGFVGADLALGLSLEARYLNAYGLELDLIRQQDYGRGIVKLRGQADVCYVPRVPVSVPTAQYSITIGQPAWHLPLLAKLALLAHHDRTGMETREGARQEDHPIYEGYNVLTFALGPEFVFPDKAELDIAPSGLYSPRRAKASNYVMVTGALGWEWRLTRAIDLRLFTSLRGSYNPAPKDSVRLRAEYELSGGQVLAVAYRSEWRYQLGANLGLSWFF
jgi:hypothetical protein